MRSPKGLIVALIIIAAPFVWLCIQINDANLNYNVSGDAYKKTEEQINTIIEEEINNAVANNPSGSTYAEIDSGESKSSIYGNPISKLIEGAKVNVSSANIYQEPDDTSSIVGSVYKDTQFTVQEYENGWSNVKNDDFSGWMKSEFITKPDDTVNTGLTTAVGHKAKITVQSSLNVRQSPSTSAESIDTITNGQEVNIIGANDDESWYQIQYGTKSGWITSNKDYVKIVN